MVPDLILFRRLPRCPTAGVKMSGLGGEEMRAGMDEASHVDGLKERAIRVRPDGRGESVRTSWRWTRYCGGGGRESSLALDFREGR